MKFRKFALLAALCLACALLATACHKTDDPWPASGATNAPALTAAPAQQAAPADADVPTQQTAPAPTDVPQQPVAPGDTAAPGFNG